MKIKGRTLTYWRWRIVDWLKCLVYGNQYYIFIPVEVNKDNYISTLRCGGFQTENDAAFLAVCEAVEHARYNCDDPELLRIKANKKQFQRFEFSWNERKFSECLGIWNTWFAPFYGSYYNVLSVSFNQTDFKKPYDTNLSFEELIEE